jgi:hypothetical protein
MMIIYDDYTSLEDIHEQNNKSIEIKEPGYD